MGEKYGAPEPRLGILWFLPAGDDTSRFVEPSDKTDDVPLIAGFRTLETRHVDHWKTVTTFMPWMTTMHLPSPT